MKHKIANLLLRFLIILATLVALLAQVNGEIFARYLWSG